MKNFMRIFMLVGVCAAAAVPCAADVFTAKDGAFTLDMPAGWVRAANPPQDSVLCVQKGQARIDIRTTDCTRETCLEQHINRDLADVKAKKMTVVQNTYTGDEIKRFEFSTGEPLYYINFYSPKNDFSAGYFLIDGKGYSILAKNLTYAETDLIFSFISPTAHPDQPLDAIAAAEEIDIEETDLLSHDIATAADVTVIPLEETAPAQTAASRGAWDRLKHRLQNRWNKAPVKTLVSPNMPPYIRQLGHGYDALMLLIGLFFAGWCGAGIARLFIRPKRVEMTANPQALYPLKLERMYGTPSLIFRARDNQGNILTALSVRWDALFMFFGIVMMLVAVIVLAGTSFCEQLRLVPLSAFAYNTVYAVASLVLPLGFVILFCGMVWGQVAMSRITLYDRKGREAALILQKGYSLAHERYQIYFVRSKELLLAQRKRFALRRHWTLLTKDGSELATVEERSARRAVVRMVCGHLWGMLRADYDITGAVESKGVIENTHALFNKSVCNLDKPEAVAARDLLALSLLISIRDRDKWYPWFN